MTLASMTAFARQSFQSEWGSFTWELRSVNHRYLEMYIRLPELLRDQESAVRAEIQKSIHRGKIEANLIFNPGPAVVGDFKLNEPLLQQMAQTKLALEKWFSKIKVDFTSLLEWRGVLQTEALEAAPLKKITIELLNKALQDLTQTREREGAVLKNFLEERLIVIKNEIDFIEKKMPQISENERQRILARFAEFKLEVDPQRLEQEMVWLLQKMDIAEELTRLKAHVVEVQRTLHTPGAVGRRLDFLMQELNRESNTIGSKSMNSEITQSSVNLKVAIEQMREQVQNIE